MITQKRVGLRNRIRAALVAMLLALTSLVLVTSPAHAEETGGYPDANAIDCSAQFGIYTWCKNGSWYSGRGYAYRNCTDYVAWKLESLGVPASKVRGRGNGKQWDDSSAGVTLTQTPEVGDAAVWNSGTFGHVAFVEAIRPKAGGGYEARISEYNYAGLGKFRSDRWVTADNYVDFNGVGTPLGQVAPPVPAGPDDPKGNYEGIRQVHGGVRLTGWALDPNTPNPIQVHVYEGQCCANPRGAFMADIPRADVGAAFPGSGNDHGFDIFLSLPNGISGSKTYCVYAINTGAGSVSPELGCRTITFNWNPVGNYELIRRTPGGVRLTGWTLDPETADPIGVHVYEGQCCANPRGGFTANSPRPDVGGAFPGHGNNHGFEINLSVSPSVPSSKTYCAYGINTGYGNTSPELGCRTLMVDPDATGNFESLEAVSGGVRLQGWALDPDTSSAIELHVYEGQCCGSLVGIHTADTSRPDVGAAWLDYGDSHGFDITVPMSSGSHTLCVYAINGAGTLGSGKPLGCRTVTVS